MEMWLWRPVRRRLEWFKGTQPQRPQSPVPRKLGILKEANVQRRKSWLQTRFPSADSSMLKKHPL